MTDAPLDVLVLGGTSWVGGTLAAEARDRGHRVTCLARGEAGTPPDGVQFVTADRSDPTAYDEVAGRPWDVVVDVSWQPRFVRGALAALSRTAAHWAYVSSASVYSDDVTPGQAEDAPLHEPFAGDGPADWETYGPAKVACEEACRSAMGPQHVLTARAGLIGGYGDRSDRLGYWAARLARDADGERVLVPPLGSPVQVIDVADLVSWLVTGAERHTSGTFNAVGDATNLGAVLGSAAAAAGTKPALVEASGDWLEQQGVEPWLGPGSLPLWLPQPAYAGFMTRRNDGARAAGLRLRPLADTLAATLAWERELGLDRERRAGLGPDRERALLSLLG